jgi:hypothetical protein
MENARTGSNQHQRKKKEQKSSYSTSPTLKELGVSKFESFGPVHHEPEARVSKAHISFAAIVI